MSKKIVFGIILFALILAACADASPVDVSPEETPSASATQVTPDSEAESLSIPYGKNVRFEQISLDEGLSQSVVNAILQDRQGFLWVGTDDGLNRYDGYNFKIYKPDTNNFFSISDRSITALAEDEQGNIWIGTRQGGLNRYDPVSGKFYHYFHDSQNNESIASNQISALEIDENGLWIGTNNGLDFLNFERNTFTHYNDTIESPIRLGNNFVTALLKDSNGLLWIGTVSGGVNVLDLENSRVVVYKHTKNVTTSLSHNRVFSFAKGANGEVWVGTANGLNRFIFPIRFQEVLFTLCL
jgi:ligand-binding sensor domain-containing protein